MSEKIAVYCETSKEADRVKKKCGKPELSFGACDWTIEYKCVGIPSKADPDKIATQSKSCYEKAGYKIITAQEFLNEEEVFKVGDRVVCVEANQHAELKLGNNYVIKKAYKGFAGKDYLKLEGVNIDPKAKRFKLAGTNSTKDVIDPSEEDLCDFCEGQFENMSRDRCEGCRCTEAMEMYLEENNLTATKEGTMLKVNETIRKVFKGEEFELVEKMQENFGDEIAENFTGEILLRRDKAKYIAEIDKRDKAAAKAAEK